MRQYYYQCRKLSDFKISLLSAARLDVPVCQMSISSPDAFTRERKPETQKAESVKAIYTIKFLSRTLLKVRRFIK